ncbi:malonate transporter [Inquilinus ginsengisoli]|uniref:AEC family transporter n=1 Tax=Inquilinus ginsengisoli TaxID=363840 RepID=UPI003D222D13
MTGAMQAVIDVALPVFGVIFLGYFAGRIRLLGRAQSEALNGFVYWIALPALLFLAMARTPVAGILNLNFIGAFLGGVLAVWLLGSVLGALIHRADAGEATMQGMNAGFSNTGYMGIPLFAAAFGPARGLPPASLATVIMSVACVGLAVVALELTGSRGRGILAALRDVAVALLKNPLVVAPVLGVLWSWSGLAVPTPLATLLSLLGAAASPCALFAIGLFMASQTLRSGLGEVGWISVLKLVWQPLITWGLAATVFPMDPFWTASAVILAALPTGALTFVVAQRYGVYVERTSAVILVSTVVSVLTLSLLLAVYAPQFPAG